jgi:hypothetical protein
MREVSGCVSHWYQWVQPHGRVQPRRRQSSGCRTVVSGEVLLMYLSKVLSAVANQLGTYLVPMPPPCGYSHPLIPVVGIWCHAWAHDRCVTSSDSLPRPSDCTVLHQLQPIIRRAVTTSQLRSTELMVTGYHQFSCGCARMRAPQ